MLFTVALLGLRSAYAGPEDIDNSDGLETCPASAPMGDDAGGCYPSCQTGYVPTGPLCILDQSLSASCSAGLEEQDGLCYPSCRADEKGVGPVCWQRNCPKSFRDDGAFCAKPASYGRGGGYPWKFGDSMNLDAARRRCEKRHTGGCEKYGEIIYPRCAPGFAPVGCCTCSPVCPDGMKDIGVSCAKKSRPRGAGTSLRSYGRGALTASYKCTDRSFTRPREPVKEVTAFNVLFASDSQVAWYLEHGGKKLRGGGCDPKSWRCRYTESKRANSDLVTALNSVDGFTWNGRKVRPPKMVIMNGDLTQHGHTSEWNWFDWHYSKVRWPFFPGLGNHDYVNNANDCANNRCVKNSVNWMRTAISCGRMKNFPHQQLHSYDTSSMAYSWDVGAYHFIQLHNHPFSQKNQAGHSPPSIGSSEKWLENDLKAATAANRHIIINMHDWESVGSNPAWYAKFKAMMAGTNVRAVFVGHIHERHGHIGHVLYEVKPPPGQDTAPPEASAIPIFYSGAADYMTFLLAEFGVYHMVVAVMNGTGGRIAMNRTYKIPLPALKNMPSQAMIDQLEQVQNTTDAIRQQGRP